MRIKYKKVWVLELCFDNQIRAALQIEPTFFLGQTVGYPESYFSLSKMGNIYKFSGFFASNCTADSTDSIKRFFTRFQGLSTLHSYNHFLCVHIVQL